MLIDPAGLAVGAVAETTVCVVGSGAAGMTVALALAEAGVDVVLLEAGGRRAGDDDSLWGDLEGAPEHDPLERVRQRRLGGTTMQWGERCLPLDEVDLEPREWVRGSGWPIRLAQCAEVVDLTEVQRSSSSRLLRRVAGSYVALAVGGLRRVLRGGVDVVLCDNENEALVLAVLLKLLRRRIPLVTLAVAPCAAKKAPFFNPARLQGHIDVWLPFASAEAERLVTDRQVRAERVRLLPSHADAAHFDSAAVNPADVVPPTSRPYVQDRDYATLVAAARDLPVDVVIDSSSAYSRSADSFCGQPLQANTVLVELDERQPRDAYALAEVVVAPTVENEIGSGSTSVLEGIAMSRPIVTTRASANGDVLSDRRKPLRDGGSTSTRGAFEELFAAGHATTQGPHGFYVRVGDVPAMRSALCYLLGHPEEASQMGRNGRQLVVQALSIEHFADRVVTTVREVSGAQASPDNGAG